MYRRRSAALQKFEFKCSRDRFMHMRVRRSPLPGVCNSVVFIQSGSGHDHDRVTSANCSKEVLG